MRAPMLPRNGDTQHMTQGKRVVPLHSESAHYREWDITVGHTRYCIVNEDETWTLMYYRPGNVIWMDVPDMDVETFLATHKLILAV